ncbi:MAG: alpha/beta fold hydrolase [Bacteroidia bacterium]
MLILIGLLLVAPYLLPIVTEEIPKDYLPFPESRFIEIENVRFHYREWPSETDDSKGNIFLIHGFSASTFCWRNNVKAFSQAGYNVVAVDIPPFGFSDREANINHSTTNRCRLLWMLADSLKKDKWIIGGHSMGGGIATVMAATNPEKTEKLILIDGVALSVKKSKTSILQYVLRFQPIHRWAEVIGKNFFYNDKKFKELLTSAYTQIPDSVAVAGYKQPFMYKGLASGIFKTSAYSNEITDVNMSILDKIPTLIFWGEKDNWVPLNSGQAYKKAHPHAQLEIIEGAGHCPMETHSEIFNKKTIEFLNSH